MQSSKRKRKKHENDRVLCSRVSLGPNQVCVWPGILPNQNQNQSKKSLKVGNKVLDQSNFGGEVSNKVKFEINLHFFIFQV